MSDPGWSDITSTNALLGTVLKGLGYQQKVDTLAVPVTYKSVGEGIIDVFLGNWMPAQKKFVEPLIAEGKLQVVRKNLDNLKFTLAVPAYVTEGGVRTVEDLDEICRQVRQEDLRHRARRPGQSEHAGHDQGRRLWTERLGGRRIERAGDARAGRPGRPAEELDRLRRLGAASHEHEDEDDLPVRAARKHSGRITAPRKSTR